MNVEKDIDFDLMIVAIVFLVMNSFWKIIER